MENELLTVGKIAEKLAISVFAADYLIRSRGIEPVSRAGRLRIFSEEDVQKLRNELGSNQKLNKAKER